MGDCSSLLRDYVLIVVLMTNTHYYNSVIIGLSYIVRCFVLDELCIVGLTVGSNKNKLLDKGG